MDWKLIKECLPLDIREHYILSFIHGSYVYGTNNEKSDTDIIVIVDDDIKLTDDYNGIKELHVFNGNDIDFDFQIINSNIHSKRCYMSII